MHNADTTNSETLSFIIIIDTPRQPENVSATALNSTIIELTWMEPHDNNAPITGYIVQYQQPQFLGGQEINKTLLSESKLTIIVKLIIVELHPGTIYTFTVEARNKLGIGERSTGASARTLEERKPSLIVFHNTINCNNLTYLIAQISL